MATLKKLTGLETFERSVQVTARTSENYQLAVNALEAAKVHFAAKNKIVDLAKSVGFIRNKFDKICAATGVSVKAFTGFAKHNEETGKWDTFCFDHVAGVVGVPLEGYPEIN